MLHLLRYTWELYFVSVFRSLKLRAGLVSFIFGKALDNLCEEKKKSMISI